MEKTTQVRASRPNRIRSLMLATLTPAIDTFTKIERLDGAP